MSARDFRPVCPRCGALCRSNARNCKECGARTGVVPLPTRARAVWPVEPRPAETGEGRYVVRETQGFRITDPIVRPPTNGIGGIECVVLDTAWNHRRVASFTSESQPRTIGRAAMFEHAREQARTRCDELNRSAAV